MIQKWNLRHTIVVFSILSIILLFLFPYATVYVSSHSESISYTQLIEYKSRMVLLMGFLILFILYLIFNNYIKEYEKHLYIGTSIVAILTQLLLWGSIKNNFVSDSYNGGSLSAGFSYYIVLYSLLAILLCSLEIAKDIDVGNETVNTYINKASNVVTKTASSVGKIAPSGILIKKREDK